MSSLTLPCLSQITHICTCHLLMNRKTERADGNQHQRSHEQDNTTLLSWTSRQVSTSLSVSSPFLLSFLNQYQLVYVSYPSSDTHSTQHTARGCELACLFHSSLFCCYLGGQTALKWPLNFSCSGPRPVNAIMPTRCSIICYRTGMRT